MLEARQYGAKQELEANAPWMPILRYQIRILDDDCAVEYLEHELEEQPAVVSLFDMCCERANDRPYEDVRPRRWCSSRHSSAYYCYEGERSMDR